MLCEVVGIKWQCSCGLFHIQLLQREQTNSYDEKPRTHWLIIHWYAICPVGTPLLRQLAVLLGPKRRQNTNGRVLSQLFALDNGNICRKLLCVSWVSCRCCPSDPSIDQRFLAVLNNVIDHTAAHKSRGTRSRKLAAGCAERHPAGWESAGYDGHDTWSTLWIYPLVIEHSYWTSPL